MTLLLPPKFDELRRHAGQVRCDCLWLGQPMHHQRSLAWPVHKPGGVADILSSKSVPSVCRNHAARGLRNIH